MSEEKKITSIKVHMTTVLTLDEHQTFTVEVDNNGMTITIVGHKNFNGTGGIGPYTSRVIWPVFIGPALKCIEWQYHQQIINALTMFFMMLDQVRDDSIAMQIANVLITKSMEMDEEKGSSNA